MVSLEVDDVTEGTHGAELSEGDASVSVLVGVDDGLVHDLLQLRVLQVVAHHHLQHLEQLPVGDVAVLIHVIDPERNWGQTGGLERERERGGESERERERER